MPREFVSNFVLKIAGILDVFQDFYKQKFKQKIGHFAKREFLEVPCCLAQPKMLSSRAKHEVRSREILAPILLQKSTKCVDPSTTLGMTTAFVDLTRKQ